jgi:hypothetical protein
LSVVNCPSSVASRTLLIDSFSAGIRTLKKQMQLTTHN